MDDIFQFFGYCLVSLSKSHQIIALLVLRCNTLRLPKIMVSYLSFTVTF